VCSSDRGGARVLRGSLRVLRFWLLKRLLNFRLYLLTQIGHSAGQLSGASRRFAQPKGNAWRLALGVLHAHLAGVHAQDFPGSVAELENISGHALDGEVFIDRADEG